MYENKFKLLSTQGYFQNRGVDIMAFDDIYPEGHQSGVSIIMHGNRIATNGDIRFEQTPGQWQPVPKQEKRELDEATNTITTTLSFPDLARHLKGFNPMIYPDFQFQYEVKVTGEGSAVVVRVDLDRPVPEQFIGKLCFNLELFPGALMGKPWIMDKRQGIFPEQPNGPTKVQNANYQHTLDSEVSDPKGNLAGLLGRVSDRKANPAGLLWEVSDRKANPAGLLGEVSDRKANLAGLLWEVSDRKANPAGLLGEASDPKANPAGLPGDYNPIIGDDIIGEPYAVGKRFTVRPEDPHHRFTVESKGAKLKLYDGRMNHNNGWFVLSSEIPVGTTKNAIHWVITPNVIEDWLYPPVIQISQVGYHLRQRKVAIIELDKRDENRAEITLWKITEMGLEKALTGAGSEWGQFLRYQYLQFDFSDIEDEGLYQIQYGESKSSIFRLAADIYDRGVWQPVLEYFLPVQMCHMRVSEKYRVWHGLCHDEDAYMAPPNFIHIDGYEQGLSTLTKYQQGDKVPGLNVGGWHDAGDFDLRIESQGGEFYILSMAYEAFQLYYDATSIAQATKTVEIHQPDGQNDLLQQVEHGVLSVVRAYQSLGRLYRGIIEADLRQYVHLGDSASMLGRRLVFTEDNPARELTAAAHLSAASRVLAGHNKELSEQALWAAQEIYDCTDEMDKSKVARVHAAIELFLTTKEDKYKDYLLAEGDFIAEKINQLGWLLGRVDTLLEDEEFSAKIRGALYKLREEIREQCEETPYGIPYRPHIWGAGWNIQRLGYEYYHLHRAYPEIFDRELVFDALHFVLGCHPGSNTMSFASGVGTKSATVGYGLNRADWSYIPGGVISGTALIRPDFPELLVFPYLWQQVEYVMGGGSSHYMFLVLAALQILQNEIP